MNLKDFDEFTDDWSSSSNFGRREPYSLIKHGDIVLMPDDADALYSK